MFLILGVIIFLTLLYIQYQRTTRNNEAIVHIEWDIYLKLFINFFAGMHPVNLTQIIYNRYKNVKQFASFNVFVQKIHLPTNLEIVKHVLVKDFQHFQDRDFYINENDDVLSGGIFGIEGERWKNIRTNSTPLLTSNKVKKYVSLVNEVGDNLKKHINEKIKTNQIIEMKDLMARSATDIIGKFALSIEINTLLDENDKFIRMARTIFQDYFFALKVFLLRPYTKIAHFFKIIMYSKDTNNFFLNIVTSIIEDREATGVVRADILEKFRKMKQCPSMRINPDDEEEKLPLDDVSSQTFAYFLAAIETVSNALTFTINEFAMHPEIQEKARDNVRQSLENQDGCLNAESLAEMTYLEQCLSETLRKYPPVTATSRRVTKEYQIPGTKEILKKNSCIMILIHAMHHDPEYFPEPDKYDPERFSPENVKKRNPYTYLPFGAGPRFCVGYSFAVMEIKTLLATLLNNYKLLPTSMEEVKFSLSSITLTPLNDVNVRVEKLDY